MSDTDAARIRELMKKYDLTADEVLRFTAEIARDFATKTGA